MPEVPAQPEPSAAARGPRKRLRTLVIGAAVLLASIAYVIVLASIDLRSTPEGNTAPIAVELWWFWSAAFALWASLTAVVVMLLHSERRQALPDADRPIRDKGARRTTWLIPLGILALALAARLAIVFTTTPVFSGDIFRYIHDGATLARGDNPYVIPPEAYLIEQVDAPPPHPPILHRINHPEYVTIYLPVSQAVFAVAWTLRAEAMDPLGHVTFRLVFVALDLFVLVLIMAAVWREGRTLWWGLVYALHPLPLLEVAGSGHQDVIGVALLLTTLLFAQRAARSMRSAASSGLAFAATLAVKPVVAPLAIPLAWHVRRKPAHLVVALLATCLGGILCFAPFLFMPGGITGLLATGGAYFEHWAFNNSLHELIKIISLDHKRPADLAGGLIILVALAVAIRRRADLWSLALTAVFAWLLTTPTVYPWYLLWLLPLVVIRFNAAAWYFSFAVLLSYEVLLHPWHWRVHLGVVMIEYLPVYGLLLWALLAGGRGRRAQIAGSSGRQCEHR